MRLEDGHRQSVLEQGAALIDSLESAVLALSSASDRAAVLAGMISQAQTLRAACSGLRGLKELEDTLTRYGQLLERLAAGSVVLDDKVGGVLLHATGSFRHALTNLGTETRAARLLPKLLADLRKVMEGLRSRPQRRDVEPAKAAQAVATDYRQAFLHDEAGTFSSISEYQAVFVADATQALNDGKSVGELFRLFHTVKGNAMALGFPKLAALAHAAEDLLNLLFLSQFPQDAVTGKFLSEQLQALMRSVRQLRDSGQEPESLTESAHAFRRFLESRGGTGAARPERPSERKPDTPVVAPEETRGGLVEKAPLQPASSFYLSVIVGGREAMIPCGSVAQVLHQPLVMAVPGGRKGWLGVIRSEGGLIPLVEPDALVAGNAGPATSVGWVVVLRAQSETTEQESMFSMPVENVGQVIEFPFGIEDSGHSFEREVTVLDVPSMVRKIGTK